MKRLLLMLVLLVGLLVPTVASASIGFYWSGYLTSGPPGTWTDCPSCRLNRAYVAYDTVPGNTPYHVALFYAYGSWDPAGAHVSGVNDVQWGYSGSAWSRNSGCWIPSPYASEHTNCRNAN